MLKPKDENLRIDYKRFSLKDIIEEVVEEFGKKIKSNNIDLKMELDEEYTLGIKSEIRAIVVHLVDNAVRYSRDKRVYLKLYEEEDRVKFEIFNKCRQIPKSIRDRLFEPFIKYNDKSEGVGRLGLGLFVCRQLAELNKAIISFEYGKDSIRFILSLVKA
ncbi:sensor histidine kinase [Clostridium cylindrosporum]|uniref:histidine kinase n=1 Tax=Clostridium cylindrosporum DSM 605 TaxID=1121307 RepID=A0A0J8D818_CLOCY|nr:HAMP domain-containing sensor histidine kinase [Clostridium cylindrosporum]KMT22200.1 hypothetical protein CLCY_4c01730 [Clostridium cylindrosporum DSM 605]